MQNEPNELTVTVAPGVKVRVQEAKTLNSDDPRVPRDRDAIISTSKDLKIALSRDTAPELEAKASIITMCG